MVQTRNDFANDRIRNAAKKLGAYVAFSSEMLVSLMFAPSFSYCVHARTLLQRWADVVVAELGKK